MEVREYRRQVEEQLGSAVAVGADWRPNTAELIAAGRRLPTPGADRSPEPNATAFAVSGANPSDRVAALVDGLTATLADESAPSDRRAEALAELKQADFFGSLLAPFRADCTMALRAAARSGDDELRQSALEVLAAYRDPVARDMLIHGLRDPGRALVPPAKALQLLGYDDHGDAVPLAREILSSGPDEETKEEALRLLATDPASVDLLSAVLANRSEHAGSRSVAAVGVQALDPELFGRMARQIVNDEHEDDDLRSACLSALAHLQGHAATRQDTQSAASVGELAEKATSPNLRASAARFLQRSQR